MDTNRGYAKNRIHHIPNHPPPQHRPLRCHAHLRLHPDEPGCAAGNCVAGSEWDLEKSKEWGLYVPGTEDRFESVVCDATGVSGVSIGAVTVLDFGDSFA